MTPRFPQDLKASIVVSLVALPLCLGIALASGAPLSSGILAGIIGGIVTGFISGSQISVSGPAAGLTVIVLSQIERFGLDQFYQIVFWAGVLQILFSLIKGGKIGDLFPNGVIHGMLAAIGITLIIKQLPVALGASLNFINFSPAHILISIFTLVTILFWDKFSQKREFISLIPSALLAVCLTALINGAFQLLEPQYLVSIPQDLMSSIKPTFPESFNFSLLMPALTIALVASIESLLCIDASDKIDPEKRITNKNRELLAQGVGNAFCGILGALPVTAVIVRTSTNISAGGKTKWAAIFHGVWLILFVCFAFKFLNMVPLATLATILLIVGYRLTKPSLFIAEYKKGIDQFIIFTSTIIAILATDLLKGIIIGLVLVLIMEARFFKNKIDVKVEEKKKIVTFTGRTTYLTKLSVLKVFNELQEEETLIVKKSDKMNPDVLHLLDDLKKRYPSKIVIS